MPARPFTKNRAAKPNVSTGLHGGQLAAMNQLVDVGSCESEKLGGLSNPEETIVILGGIARLLCGSLDMRYAARLDHQDERGEPRDKTASLFGRHLSYPLRVGGELVEGGHRAEVAHVTRHGSIACPTSTSRRRLVPLLSRRRAWPTGA
jgi:hypothetical protein